MYDQGLWRGVLYLLVAPPKPQAHFYGIEIPTELYFGAEEMIYSVSDHGDAAGAYDGDVFIKEAEKSALLTAFLIAHPWADHPSERRPRHFAFVGSDYCFEVLSFSEPIIRAFDSEEEAYAWGPPRTE